MIKLSDFLRQITEARLDLKPIKDLFNELTLAETIPTDQFLKIQKEIIDWCENNATELSNFTAIEAKKHAGMIIVDTDINKYALFPLLALCPGRGIWAQVSTRSDRAVSVDATLRGFKFSGDDTRDINKSKTIRVFVIDDQRFNSVLRADKKLTSDHGDKYLAMLETEFDLNKGEVPSGDYNFSIAQPVEVIGVDSMDVAVASKLANMMLKGKSFGNEIVLGVNKNAVVFVLSHWGGQYQSGRYYEKGARMANAFKTIKKFKEFFTKDNLKDKGVEELRIYEPNI